MNAKGNLKSLDDFIDEEYGKKGNLRRDAFEEGFERIMMNTLQHYIN